MATLQSRIVSIVNLLIISSVNQLVVWSTKSEEMLFPEVQKAVLKCLVQYTTDFNFFVIEE